MRLQFARGAVKSLRGLEPGTAQTIREALGRIAADPFGHHPNVERMAGIRDGFRLRHGDLRALYRLDRDADMMLVYRVGRRGEVYRR